MFCLPIWQILQRWRRRLHKLQRGKFRRFYGIVELHQLRCRDLFPPRGYRLLKLCGWYISSLDRCIRLYQLFCRDLCHRHSQRVLALCPRKFPAKSRGLVMCFLRSGHLQLDEWRYIMRELRGRNL